MSDEIPAFLPPPPPGGGPWRHHPRRAIERTGLSMIMPESWSLYIGSGNVAVRREGEDAFDVEVWELSFGGHRRYHVPGSEVAATLRECCRKLGGEGLASLWPEPPVEGEGGAPRPEIPNGPERVVAFQHLDATSTLTHSKTNRGFALVEFEDHNGRPCSLQQSSAAIYEGPPGASAIWLGSWGDRMHLDIEQVEALVPMLQSWLERGTFDGSGLPLDVSAEG